MSYELLNTSAPHGLRPGTAGFCTVAMTAGVPPALEERLTLLSGYRGIVSPGETGAQNNPVAFSHWRLTAGGQTLSVLSRVSDAGFDYSRRSNRFAHHVVVESTEQAEPGPAWVMMQPGIMRASWSGEPTMYPQGPEIPQGQIGPRVCSAWATAGGDAGWAGVLAESVARDPMCVAYIICPPDMDVLPLVDEAVSLLRPPVRWQVTFCTYFTELPAGMDCNWRFCVAGSRAATEASRQPGPALLIDLTKALSPPSPSAFVDAARDGSTVRPEPVRRDVVPEADLNDAPSASRASAGAIAAARKFALREGGAPVSKDAGGPPVPRQAFWLVAIAWPLIVAAGIIAYVHYQHVNAVAPALSPAILPPTTQPQQGSVILPAANPPATTQAIEADERDRTIAQLRDSLAEMKDDLAAAKLRAAGDAAALAELDSLKAENAILRGKVAAATQPTTSTAVGDHK